MRKKNPDFERNDHDLPQDAEANLAIAVEVGVEADCVVSRGDELDPGGVDGVVRWAAEQEEKEAAFIWSVKWPCDKCVDLSGINEIVRLVRSRSWFNGQKIGRMLGEEMVG